MYFINKHTKIKCTEPNVAMSDKKKKSLEDSFCLNKLKQLKSLSTIFEQLLSALIKKNVWTDENMGTNERVLFN